MVGDATENKESVESQVYLQRLSSINNSNPVTATEDILNEDGVLLLKNGSRINGDATEKLLRFKLLKPIEESVGLQNILAGQQLYERMLMACEQSDIYRVLFKSCAFGGELAEMCGLVDEHPVLVQKITVHAQLRPVESDKALMCAWISLHIGKILELEQGRLQSMFLAALAHDIGMLHIDPAVTDNKGELSPEDWRSLQCHVVIGEKILRAIGLPAACSQAILEHHERCDGSGYPKNLTYKKLSLEGQVVAVSDMMVAVIQNKLSPQGRTVADLIPVMQVNSEVHFYQTYDVIVRWLRAAADDIEQLPTQVELDGYVKQVKALRREVADRIDIINDVLQQLDREKVHKKIRAVSLCKYQLDRVLDSSGILYTYYANWLDENADCSNPTIVKEINNTLLMLDETRWRLRHIERSLQLFVDHEQAVSSSARQVIDEGLERLAVY